MNKRRIIRLSNQSTNQKKFNAIDIVLTFDPEKLISNNDQRYKNKIGSKW